MTTPTSTPDDTSPAPAPAAERASLDLIAIGNSRVAALLDHRGDVVWFCVPRFDGDPVFCALLDHDHPGGRFSTKLAGEFTTEQRYEPNTAIARTIKQDSAGNAIEQIDFCPRYRQHDRMFAPVSLVRVVRRIAGRPRIRVDFSPRVRYGSAPAEKTSGSHHVRALVPDHALRLTTDAPITHLTDGTPFMVEDSVTFVIGPDETLLENPRDYGRRALAETNAYWLRWVRNLALPFEWQDAVIRAAITLKLNTFDDTGGIIAAMTTSIPEAPDTGRNWDYRYCWLRDAYFVVNALNKLGATGTLERYLRYLDTVLSGASDNLLQPVYALNGRSALDETIVETLPGYRGMGPVRNGNLAYVQAQHDVYGAAVLAVTHAFFDRRLLMADQGSLFESLEPLGVRAWELHDQPDAGIWEYRGRREVHTFSSLMCWAACDRLGRIAQHLGRSDRALLWYERARHIHGVICERAWNESLQSFAGHFGGDTLDASVLLMSELGFLDRNDARLVSTVRVIAQTLKRGDFLLRYAHADDFGLPDTAFVVCSFWWIQALANLGERELARELFEKLLARRNKFGLLAEDMDPTTGESWGNYPQTYSMVGIIMCAMRLSIRWDDAF